MNICRRAEAPVPAAQPSDAEIRQAAEETQAKAEAVIFATNGPAYPGVGNGSTSGPNQS